MSAVTKGGGGGAVGREGKKEELGAWCLLGGLLWAAFSETRAGRSDQWEEVLGGVGRTDLAGGRLRHARALCSLVLEYGVE